MQAKRKKGREVRDGQYKLITRKISIYVKPYQVNLKIMKSRKLQYLLLYHCSIFFKILTVY